MWSGGQPKNGPWGAAPSPTSCLPKSPHSCGLCGPCTKQTSPLLRWGETLTPSALKPQTSCLCTSSSAASAWELPGLWLGRTIWCPSRANPCRESADISTHRDHHPMVPPAMPLPAPSGPPHERCSGCLMCAAAAQGSGEGSSSRDGVWRQTGLSRPTDDT